MATKGIARGGPRKTASVPIRNITHEDLSIALRQGLDDFLTFRGDIVFAGIVYTVIGIAAVVMTASAPLMPFAAPTARCPPGLPRTAAARICGMLAARCGARTISNTRSRTRR